jgi:hypothetical protein
LDDLHYSDYKPMLDSFKEIKRAEENLIDLRIALVMDKEVLRYEYNTLHVTFGHTMSMIVFWIVLCLAISQRLHFFDFGFLERNFIVNWFMSVSDQYDLLKIAAFYFKLDI